MIGANAMVNEDVKEEYLELSQTSFFPPYVDLKQLDSLSQLLTPQPALVASQVAAITKKSVEGTVTIIHAPSMFAGKTTALCNFVALVGIDKVLGFQPQSAIRYGSEQLNAIMSRDGLKVRAETIEGDNLMTIIDILDKKQITPRDYPYIVIDEGMLFTHHGDNFQSAIAALEAIRLRGFHVVFDGIDYTFQEEPFTFMHSILSYTKKNTNWYQIEMSTKCIFCGEKARGTMRLKKTDSGKYAIASYFDTAFQPGDSEYLPVCCQKHPSCINKPKNFVRQEIEHV